MTTNGLVAPGSTPRPRSRTAPAKRRRRTHRGFAVVLLVIGLLVGTGTAAGYGIGRAVDWVRDAWPEPPLELVADKAAPPEALDPAGVAETCDPSAVRAELTGNRTSLVLDEAMSMTMSVTNGGRVPCLLDGHRSSMQVVVTEADGGDRVWSSADCVGGGEELVLLGTDQRWELTVRWTGSGSTPDCASVGDVPAGAYTASVRLDDVPGVRGEPLTIAVEEAPEPEPQDEEGAQAADGEASGDTADGTQEQADGETSEQDGPGDKASEKSGGRSESGQKKGDKQDGEASDRGGRGGD
ncbi:hypothetical protein [Isoptericola sp. AK164]|uniref:hypothetical protein n=1 Tax=Isoptericola sp. AK164 TaxID=3024246 RepID=UPI0024185D41|nr:hypothetical protein [Isoptericola sp. AK164]